MSAPVRGSDTVSGSHRSVSSPDPSGPCGEVDRRHVLVAGDSGEPLGKDGPPVRVGLALPEDPVSGPLEAEVESAAA